jgi:hypothetical protein
MLVVLFFTEDKDNKGRQILGTNKNEEEKKRNLGLKGLSGQITSARELFFFAKVCKLGHEPLCILKF